MADHNSNQTDIFSRFRQFRTEKENTDNDPSEQGEEKRENAPVINWYAAFGCLVLAFFMWLFVMGTDNPGFVGELSEIPIRIENKSGLSILSGDDLTVDLKVEGKRSVVNKIDLSAVDVSVMIDANAKPGRQSYDLNIQLPGGLRLVEASMTKVMLYLDHTTSVSVPIRVKISEYTLEDRYELGLSDITTSIRNVHVTGPESLLTTIECAQVSLSLGSVTRSVTSIGTLVLVDRNGEPITDSYVKMAQSEVMVTIPVYQYRTVTPTFRFVNGYFNESNVKITASPASITVKGEAGTVDSFVWECEIDETDFATDSSYQTSLGLPAGIVCTDGTETVTISVTHVGTTLKTFSINNFRVENSGGHRYEILTEELRIRIRGEESLMHSITYNSITAVVDIGSFDVSDGTVSVPVTFRFAGAFEQKVWAVGNYSVTVRITS